MAEGTPEWGTGFQYSVSQGYSGVSRSACWIQNAFLSSPETECGSGPLELFTGGRPGSIHDKLLVVSAVVAAALCV